MQGDVVAVATRRRELWLEEANIGVHAVRGRRHFDDKESQDQITKLHLDFKRANGYSELEIANKRQAIENVLVTETKKDHINRLKECGFIETNCYFQCLNFVSFLSVK